MWIADAHLHRVTVFAPMDGPGFIATSLVRKESTEKIVKKNARAEMVLLAITEQVFWYILVSVQKLIIG